LLLIRGRKHYDDQPKQGIEEKNKIEFNDDQGCSLNDPRVAEQEMLQFTEIHEEEMPSLPNFRVLSARNPR